MRKAHNFKDLTGQRFGRLTVVSRAENTQSGQTRWNCRCDCGNKKIIMGSSLRKGITTSCGCYRKENLLKCSIKHGKKNTRLYVVWQGMRRRCFDTNIEAYKNYGGRGITVCPKWLDFESFYTWAIANGYDENAKRGECTLDRIDVNGNYEPDNCRWVNMKAQANNMRKNVNLEYNGETKTLREWCELLNLSYNTIYGRLMKGWDIQKALETPIRKSHRQTKRILQKDMNGKIIKEYENLRQVSLQNGYNQGSITKCCNKDRKTAYGYIWEFLDD